MELTFHYHSKTFVTVYILVVPTHEIEQPLKIVAYSILQQWYVSKYNVQACMQMVFFRVSVLFCMLCAVQVDIVPSLPISLQQIAPPTAPPTFCYILRCSEDCCAHLLGNRFGIGGVEGDHLSAPIMISHNDLSQGVTFGCVSGRLSLLGRVVHTHREVRADCMVAKPLFTECNYTTLPSICFLLVPCSFPPEVVVYIHVYAASLLQEFT